MKEKGERREPQINYPRRSLRRYNKIISGRLYRDSGCERRGRHKVAACAPTAAVINNSRERRRAAACISTGPFVPRRATALSRTQPLLVLVDVVVVVVVVLVLIILGWIRNRARFASLFPSVDEGASEGRASVLLGW